MTSVTEDRSVAGIHMSLKYQNLVRHQLQESMKALNSNPDDCFLYKESSGEGEILSKANKADHFYSELTSNNCSAGSDPYLVSETGQLHNKHLDRNKSSLNAEHLVGNPLTTPEYKSTQEESQNDQRIFTDRRSSQSGQSPETLYCYQPDSVNIRSSVSNERQNQNPQNGYIGSGNGIGLTVPSLDPQSGVNVGPHSRIPTTTEGQNVAKQNPISSPNYIQPLSNSTSATSMLDHNDDLAHKHNSSGGNMYSSIQNIYLKTNHKDFAHRLSSSLHSEAGSIVTKSSGDFYQGTDDSLKNSHLEPLEDFHSGSHHDLSRKLTLFTGKYLPETTAAESENPANWIPSEKNNISHCRSKTENTDTGINSSDNRDKISSKSIRNQYHHLLSSSQEGTKHGFHLGTDGFSRSNIGNGFTSSHDAAEGQLATSEPCAKSILVVNPVYTTSTEQPLASRLSQLRQNFQQVVGDGQGPSQSSPSNVVNRITENPLDIEGNTSFRSSEGSVKREETEPSYRYGFPTSHHGINIHQSIQNGDNVDRLRNSQNKADNSSKATHTTTTKTGKGEQEDDEDWLLQRLDTNSEYSSRDWGWRDGQPWEIHTAHRGHDRDTEPLQPTASTSHLSTKELQDLNRQLRSEKEILAGEVVTLREHIDELTGGDFPSSINSYQPNSKQALLRKISELESQIADLQEVVEDGHVQLGEAQKKISLLSSEQNQLTQRCDKLTKENMHLRQKVCEAQGLYPRQQQVEDSSFHRSEWLLPRAHGDGRAVEVGRNRADWPGRGDPGDRHHKPQMADNRRGQRYSRVEDTDIASLDTARLTSPAILSHYTDGELTSGTSRAMSVCSDTSTELLQPMSLPEHMEHQSSARTTDAENTRDWKRVLSVDDVTKLSALPPGQHQDSTNLHRRSRAIKQRHDEFTFQRRSRSLDFKSRSEHDKPSYNRLSTSLLDGTEEEGRERLNSRRYHGSSCAVGFRSVSPPPIHTQHNKPPRPAHRRNVLSTTSTAGLKPFAPQAPGDIHLDDVVKFSRQGCRISQGWVKFVGHLHGRGDVYLGVELEREEGKHDGVFEGVRYFQCKPNKGVFVAFNKVIMAWCLPSRVNQLAAKLGRDDQTASELADVV